MGAKGAQQCSGYTSGEDFYLLNYDPEREWFRGFLWCGGEPEGDELADFECSGNRGAQGQGDDVVCISHGPVPGQPGQSIDQERVSCD